MIRRWLAGRRRALVCRDAVALMSDYVDDVLDERDRARLDTHLAGCPLCTEYLAQLRATIDARTPLPLLTRSCSGSAFGMSKRGTNGPFRGGCKGTLRPLPPHWCPEV